MNAVRLNMSHATHDDAERTIRWVGTLNRKVKYPVPVILDTCGPEIRTGALDNPIELKSGNRVFLSSRCKGYKEKQVPAIEVNYQDFERTLGEGESIRVDNGLINLKVIEKSKHGLLCNIVDGGLLKGRRHVNLPGVHLNLPAISAKDREDIVFAQKHDVSYIAQSFVRNGEDVETMRELLGESRRWVRIIAKIENHEGVANAGEIADKSNGVMVARGDLGIETDIAALPGLQRRLVEQTISLGRRCIVATHLLESMVEQPIPTRAEVVDVANAIHQGVDAVMLSAETSIGNYPIRSVELTRRIIEEQEKFRSRMIAKLRPSDSHRQHLAWSASELAERVNAAGIVVITRSGYSADLLTNCTPPYVPIFAFTNESHTRRRLMLNRSVYAYRISFSRRPEITLRRAFDVLLQREQLEENASLIVISAFSDESVIDSITIRQLTRVPDEAS